MIVINLLPASQRKATGWRLPSWTPKQVAIGTGVGLGVMTAALMLWRVGLEQANRHLGTEWAKLESTKRDLDTEHERVVMLERQAMSFRRLRATGVQWAPRLNVLSDAMVPGVWLTRLQVQSVEVKAKRVKRAKPSAEKAGEKGAAEKEKEAKSSKDKKPAAPPAIVQLSVSGTALVPPGEELSPLGALVQSLKHQPDFSKYFDNVEISSVQRRKVGQLEVSDFMLQLVAKEAPSASSNR